MNRKRISRDYDLKFNEDDRGKLKPEITYHGAKYVWSSYNKKTTYRVLYTVFTVLAAALFILPLCFYNEALKALYVTIPFIFSGLPALMFIVANVRLFYKDEPYTNEAYHQIFLNTKRWALAGAILSTATIICFIIYAAVLGAKGTDFITLSSILALTAVYFAAFFTIRYFLSFIKVQENAVPLVRLSDN